MARADRATLLPTLPCMLYGARFEVFMCLGLKAKPKGVALAWIHHGNGCKKGYGCGKWKGESKLNLLT